jgi:hypothetical protein
MTTNLHHPLDPSDTWDSSFWDSIESLLANQAAAPGSYATALASALQQKSLPPTPVVLPAETAEAQAAVSASSSGGVGSVVAETSGGLTINLLFDSAAMAAPASFRAGIEQAAAILSSAISDKITLNFNIDYSGTGGGAAAGPDSGQWVSYATVRSDLISHASAGDTTFNALPAGSTIQGQSSVAVWNAQLKLWGILGANDTTTDDGSATFATDINSSLLVGVALHELTHAMGRVPYGSQTDPSPDIMEFYRFTSSGVRYFTDAIPAAASYFSLDGGNTKLADYGTSSDPSDFLNTGVQGANDPFNEYYTGSTLQQLTAIDLKQLDALGFHLATGPASTIIQTDGSTSLLQVGSSYYLDNASTLDGPQLKYGGAAVTAGEFGNIAPVGAIQTSSGYEVAWKIPGTSELAFWTTDNNGNYTGNLSGLVSGTSFTVESQETVFGQDLNGDGTIGVTASLIQTVGATSLLQIADEYYVYTNWSGPELKYGGAPLTVGEFGNINPIGAIQTSSGYEIVWKIAGADEFALWSVDSNGNYTGNLTGLVPGTSFAVESLEAAFGKDLNGDGTIGVTSVLIQANGATDLLQIANNYYMYINGSGPELKYAGAPVFVGEFGNINPVGAIQTSTGYEIAWKIPGVNEYTFWATDSNGNYTGNLTGLVSGSDPAAQQFQTLSHQSFGVDSSDGATLTLSSSSTNTVASATITVTSGVSPATTFDGTTLTLQEPSTFSGQIAGFKGDGTLSGSDKIDLHGLSFSTAQSSFDATSDTLTVSDGTTTAALHFLGQYTQDSFHFAEDGNSGTLVVAAATPGQSTSQVSNLAAHDTFVFAPNFGQISLANFTPATDTLQFSKNVFADTAALVAATHDDASGNAVITDAAHDSITLLHVTTAQLMAHQSDFHFV